jgi:hypothetical protein
LASFSTFFEFFLSGTFQRLHSLHEIIRLEIQSIPEQCWREGYKVYTDSPPYRVLRLVTNILSDLLAWCSSLKQTDGGRTAYTRGAACTESRG